MGHLSRSLAGFLPEDLMSIAIDECLHRTPAWPQAVDGVIVGWVGQGSHAPNIARVAVLKSKLPEKAPAVTIQANCVSGLESVCAAARHILLGEGDLFIAGGTESMSQMPYAIRGPRSLKPLRSRETLRENWSSLWEAEGLVVVDCIEEGLTDPVRRMSMAATAEVCAQMYSISREQQDEYAVESYRRALKGQEDGFYATHVVPVQKDGQMILERDEYPQLRKDLAARPERMAKAPTLFEMEPFFREHGNWIKGKRYEAGKTRPTLTLFNSCARSDGAAAVVVASEERARDLGLPILAEIRSWGFWGTDPVYMGIAPAFAAAEALRRAEVKFEELDEIELHEAFAATCLGVFRVGQEKFGHRWEEFWRAGVVNPYGGSIAIGHPLAATGTRILLNLLYGLQKNPKARLGLAAACAAGGMGGAMVLEKAS